VWYVAVLVPAKDMGRAGACVGVPLVPLGAPHCPTPALYGVCAWGMGPPSMVGTRTISMLLTRAMSRGWTGAGPVDEIRGTSPSRVTVVAPPSPSHRGVSWGLSAPLDGVRRCGVVLASWVGVGESEVGVIMRRGDAERASPEPCALAAIIFWRSCAAVTM